MNEQIRLLAKQAGFEITSWGNELLPCVHQEGPIDVELNKFAELIVMECLQKISGLIIPEEAILPIGSYDKWNQSLGHAALEIEQHFFGDHCRN